MRLDEWSGLFMFLGGEQGAEAADSERSRNVSREVQRRGPFRLRGSAAQRGGQEARLQGWDVQRAEGTRLLPRDQLEETERRSETQDDGRRCYVCFIFFTFTKEKLHFVWIHCLQDLI